MNIMYDSQILTLQKYGGISKYFYEMITGIEKLGHEIDIPCIYSRNEYFKEYFKKPKWDPDKKLPFGKGGGYLNKIYNLLMCNDRYDIVHPTYYDTYIIGKHSGKLIITIYDMIHERWSLEDRQTIINKKEYIYRSDKILTISESTKKDILDIYPDIDINKIVVTYLGCRLNVNAHKPSFLLPAKYVLYIGKRGSYKNFDNFLKAMKIVIHEIKEMKIICGGGGPFNEKELLLIRQLGLEDMIFQFDYTEMEAYYLYNNAECFVFPSLYEGFGIPLLESMAAGCPLLCSDSSCFPEIAGEAAIYFNGSDVRDMAEKICFVLLKSDKSDLISKGYKRVKMFSWEETIKRTLMVYDECLKQS